MRSLIAMSLVGLVLLSACAADDAEPEAAPSATPSVETVEYVESDACREGATPVVEALELADQDEDVRDVAGRLAAIEEMGASATAQCSSELAAEIRTATTGVTCRLDVMAVEVGIMDAVSPRCLGKTAVEHGADALLARIAARKLLDAEVS